MPPSWSPSTTVGIPTTRERRRRRLSTPRRRRGNCVVGRVFSPSNRWPNVHRRRTFAMEKKSFLKTGDRSREKKHSVGFFRHPVNGRTAGGQARALRGENFVCKRPRFPSPDKRAATVGLKTSTCSFLLVPEPLPAVASSSSSRPHGPLLPSVTGSFSKF